MPSGKTKTRPMWLDIDQCDDTEADVPAGYSDTHWNWKSDLSARFVTIGGHVHNYGIRIAYRNDSPNSNIFTSVAGYAAGSPSSGSVRERELTRPIPSAPTP